MQDIGVKGEKFMKKKKVELPAQTEETIEKAIENHFNVVVWPEMIDSKDINDMVLAGRNVMRIIKENTCSGLSAKAKFIAWKRI